MVAGYLGLFWFGNGCGYGFGNGFGIGIYFFCVKVNYFFLLFVVSMKYIIGLVTGFIKISVKFLFFLRGEMLWQANLIIDVAL